MLKPTCPSCDSEEIVKNGRIHTGKQHFKCKACSRQFAEAPQNKRIAQANQEWIDKLLLEKIPLAGSLGFAKSLKAGCRTTSTASMRRFPGR